MRKYTRDHHLLGSGSGDPWQELAVAVLLRAVRDSLTDPEALTWLRTRGDELAHALGWPAGVLRDYDPARVDGRRFHLGVTAGGIRGAQHRGREGASDVQRRCICATG